MEGVMGASEASMGAHDAFHALANQQITEAMAQLESQNDCDAAEEQLASLAVAVNRLPAGSFVRSGVEAALAELRSAVDARRAALGAPTPPPAAALALDARSLLGRSLDACDAAHRPATNFEAAACAVHALL